MREVFWSNQDLFSLLLRFLTAQTTWILSVIGGVLGICAVAARCSRGLFELIDGIPAAPGGDPKHISQSSRLPQPLVLPRYFVERPKHRRRHYRRRCCITLIADLSLPLGNCSSVLGQSMVKIQGFARPLDGERYRMSSNDLKWYFARKEFLELTARVETCKRTLNTGSTAIGRYVHIGLRAMGKTTPVS